MGNTLLQFHHEGAAPGLDAVARMFGIGREQLDAEYGVIATDPEAGLYTVLVDSGAVEQVRRNLAARPPHEGEGIFSNPRVAPFDTPEAE